MHPILFRIPLPGGGGFDIASYGAMLALGTLFGVFIATRLGGKDGVKAETIIDVAFWAVLCGILGAKLWYIIQYWPSTVDKMSLLRNFRSGLVFYGGFIAGAAGVLLYLRRNKLPIMKTFDVFAPSMALGLAFGRTGCFLNGCCFGKRTDSWLGVTFTRESPAFYEQLERGLVTESSPATLPVYPSQLFLLIGALALFALLLYLRRKRKFYGEQTMLLFALYAVVRFTGEFFRADTVSIIAGMRISQFTSVIAFIAAAAGFAILRIKRPARLAVEKDK